VFTAIPAVVSGNIPVSMVGNYTALAATCSGTASAIEGITGLSGTIAGAGSATVDSQGIVNMNLRLSGIASAIVSSGTLNENLEYTFLATVPNTTPKQSVQGTIQFQNKPESDACGTITWTSPKTATSPGFTRTIQIIFSKYDSSAQTFLGASLKLVYKMPKNSGNILWFPLIPADISVKQGNLNLAEKQATGLFSGWFKDIKGVSHSFTGTLFQKQKLGAGCFSYSPNKKGNLEIIPVF
jgi:hypothetical protein